MKRIFFLLAISFFLYACEQEEGIGGTSTIKGKIYAIDYTSDFLTIIDEYYIPKEDVYIIYGDDEIYSDDFETHYDGSYRFKYLQPGKYTLFAYSKDTTDIFSDVKIPAKVEVEIKEKGETVVAPDIVIIK
jgi:hypothetical protein